MSRKMLLVDDSKSVRTICRRMATALGFESLEAENGRDALDKLQLNPDVSVILLDWNMPVMDGLSFLKQFRTQEFAQRPVVVMCTTENEFSRISEAIEEGASEYIMKPFNEDIIREKLEGAGVL